MTNPDPFKHAEDEYFRLKGQLATGRLTRDQFERELKTLTVQDAQGRYWSQGRDDGKWYVYDGAKWVLAEPPREQVGAPVSLPERGGPPTATVPAARTSNRLPLVLIGALVVVALGAAAVFLLSMNRAPDSVAAVIVTPAPIATAPDATASATPASATLTATVAPPTETRAVVSSNASGIQAALVATAAPVSIPAKDFTAQNVLLVEKIAALNRAQLQVIRDLLTTSYRIRATGFAFPAAQSNSEQLDLDLKDLAGKAMDVAILADELSQVTGAQDQGSAQAVQSAEAYLNIARIAYALVADTQNVREGLSNNSILRAQAIDLIAQYGAQLWNSEVTDGGKPGNPFLALLKDAAPSLLLNADAAAQVQSQIKNAAGTVWMAQSGTQNVKTVQVPPAQRPLSEPFDPQLQRTLTTANGQSDGNTASQVAAENLRRLGAAASTSDPTAPTQLRVPVNSVAVAEAGQIQSGELPTFSSGKAVVVAKNNGDENPFLQNFGLNGQEPPSDQGKAQITDAPALVNLTLTNVTLDSVNQRPKGSGSFEADTNFSFTVNWTTNLGAPQFNLSCVSGNNQVVTQAAGSLTLKGNSPMILYPGTVDVYCYASSPSGNTLGSVSANILVGDAAGATARAIQVETDSEILNRTLTAEAQSTASAAQTQVAATVQVIATQHALETEVAVTTEAERQQTAAAFGTKQAQPPPATVTPSATPTFTPKLVDTVVHPGNVDAVSTNVALMRGHLYRFTFSGRVNLINPTQSATWSDLPEHVNGVVVPPSGVVVIEGTDSTATISCGSGVPDPDNPGAFTITVEDLGPM